MAELETPSLAAQAVRPGRSPNRRRSLPVPQATWSADGDEIRGRDRRPVLALSLFHDRFREDPVSRTEMTRR